jgi:hypothetical protein
MGDMISALLDGKHPKESDRQIDPDRQPVEIS